MTEYALPENIKLNAENRHVMVGFLDVRRSNPNGDPETSRPRIDEEGHGLISPMAIKRKVRDAALAVKDEDLYMRKGQDLNEAQLRADDEHGLLKMFRDLRWFGGVMTQLKGGRQARIRGPIVVRWGRSLDPVTIEDVTITRTGHHKRETDSGEVEGGTMGTVPLVSFGLYRFSVVYDPSGAAQVGMTSGDLHLFVQLLIEGWEHTRSAVRSDVNLRRLDIFDLGSPRGRAPSHVVEGCVRADLAPSCSGIPTQYEDYQIEVTALPDNVSHTVYDDRIWTAEKMVAK